MAAKSDTLLKAQAAVIRDETAIGANTKLRVYNILNDVIDSKLTLKTWNFADNGGDFPVSDAPTLYIALDDHGTLGDADYVPAAAWMVALVAGAEDFEDFIIKP